MQKIKDKSFAVFFHTEYCLIYQQLYCRRKVQLIVKLSKWILYWLHTSRSQVLDYWQFFPESGSQATNNRLCRLTLLVEQQKTTGLKRKPRKLLTGGGTGPDPRGPAPPSPWGIRTPYIPWPRGKVLRSCCPGSRTWVKNQAQVHFGGFYPKNKGHIHN